MTHDCPFCKLLERPQENPTYVSEFEHSVAFLDFNQQTYLGKVLLILKEHHDHLHLTPIGLQQAVVPELVNLTSGILKAFGGFRANHMSLGNQVAHVHWHIIPRYPNDLNAGNMPTPEHNFKKLTDSGYQELAKKIRLEISA